MTILLATTLAFTGLVAFTPTAAADPVCPIDGGPCYHNDCPFYIANGYNVRRCVSWPQ